MKLKNRWSGVLAIVLVLSSTMITAYAKPEWPHDTMVQAEAGIVIDADSGAVLYGQNIHTAFRPASITKLLTALVVLEHCELDEMVEYSATAINSVEAGSGDKLSLRPGDELSVRDSLYALLLASVNQCANGLAEHTAGSIQAFVGMMNEKVAELGLTDSHFDNPSGLNGDTQYVTAYDMAMIARAAYANEELLKISSTISYKIGPVALFPEGQSIKHSHRLVYTTDPSNQFYCPDAIAGKTGYLLAAGNTLVTYGERDGRHVISVILKGKPTQYFLDGKELLEFGLDYFENFSIPDNETRIFSDEEGLALNGKVYSQSELKLETGGVVTLPKGASFADTEVSLSEELPANAPIGAVGCIIYQYDGRQVGSAYLMTQGTSVEVTGSDESDNSEAGGEETGDMEISSEPENAAEPAGLKLPEISLVSLLTAVLATAAAAILIGGISWMIYNRKKEARELKLRREERRKRLQSEGEGQQEEFERLLRERWKRR